MSLKEPYSLFDLLKLAKRLKIYGSTSGPVVPSLNVQKFARKHRRVQGRLTYPKR